MPRPACSSSCPPRWRSSSRRPPGSGRAGDRQTRPAWRKKTPTVVRSAIAWGFRSLAWARSSDVRTDIDLLFDRFDGESECPGRHAHGDLVALFLAHQRAADRGLDRDSARRRITFHGADKVIRLGGAIGVDHVDGRTRPGDSGVRLLDDLSSPDHLLQLVDSAVEETDLLFGLLVLGVVLDVSGLERLLEAFARLGAPLQGDLQIVLELLEALGSEQKGFS